MTKISHFRWYIIVLVFLAAVLNYVDRQTLSALTPTIQRDLAMEDRDYANIVNIFLVAYTLACRIAGKLADVRGTQLGTVIFVGWWSVANMLTAAALSSPIMHPIALPRKSILLRAWHGQWGPALRISAIATMLGFGTVGLGSDAAVQRNTQFKPGQPWLDTQGTHLNAHGFGLLDFGGRHYWYGAHKIAGKTESEKNEAGVRCYVSDDLFNWQDAGLVLSALAPGAHPELADAFILDRPKVIYHANTKKFILYFKLYPPKSQGGKSGIDYGYVGVATSAQPTGPFQYQGRFLGGNSAFGTGDFAIFSDNDGSVYHIAVRKPDKALVCGRLSEDGLRPAGDYVEMTGTTRSTEAPALFRRGAKIFLLGSGSTGWAPNAARTFVADRVTGPYQELDNPCQGVNPHNNLGPEKTFGGQSTFIYPVAGRRDAWVAMFDINQPQDPITAGYIWLPIEFEGDRPVIRWRDQWDLSVFSKQ